MIGRSKYQGFTLIELIMYVFILGLVVGLLSQIFLKSNDLKMSLARTYTLDKKLLLFVDNFKRYSKRSLRMEYKKCSTDWDLYLFFDSLKLEGVGGYSGLIPADVYQRLSAHNYPYMALSIHRRVPAKLLERSGSRHAYLYPTDFDERGYQKFGFQIDRRALKEKPGTPLTATVLSMVVVRDLTELADPTNPYLRLIDCNNHLDFEKRYIRGDLDDSGNFIVKILTLPEHIPHYSLPIPVVGMELEGESAFGPNELKDRCRLVIQISTFLGAKPLHSFSFFLPLMEMDLKGLTCK